MATVNLTANDDAYISRTAGDVIYGLGGNDTLKASDGGNALYGGDGDDVLNGGAGSDTLQGDTNTGDDFFNILNGFGGNDVINSRSWSDQVNAGTGDDLVNSYAQRTSQVIDGGIGNDRLNVLSLNGVNDPINMAFGATFVFTVKGINGATYMNFESIEMTLGTGANTITGSNGNDRLYTAFLNGGNATIGFDAGFIRAAGGDDVVAFNGVTRAGTGIQRMNGGSGVDTLFWGNGDAVIGDMAINAANGTMMADGATFATFVGFEVVDFTTFEPITGSFDYSGFAGADRLSIGALTSQVNTFGGNDRIELDAGSATINAGAGNDFLRIGAATGVVTMNGGQGADSLYGGWGAATLIGGDGDDLIQATNSHSQIFGGRGNDTMSFSLVPSVVGSGVARIDGGAGQDVLTLTLQPGTAALVLDLTAPTLNLAGGALVTGFEGVRLMSTSGADDITASQDARGAAYNTVDGGAGNDTLRAAGAGVTFNGGYGADSLIGGAGKDVLRGGYFEENDTLRGLDGNDVLISEAGRDLLIGGRGADRFTLLETYNLGRTAATRDVIVDFSHAQGDRIDLAAVDAIKVSGSLPNDSFTFIGTAAFGTVAGRVRYEQFDLAGKAYDITLVTGELNGDGIADFTIEMRGLVTLIDTDFVL